MVRSIHTAGWTTGFYATAGILPEEKQDPVVLVMEASAQIGAIITELCMFMHVQMVRVADEPALRRNLWIRRPIGVLCNLTEVETSADCGVLKMIADYDRTLPVLLVSHNHPGTLGVIDAVEDLCRMTSVTRVTTAPAAFEIVEFMFNASRRSGLGRGLKLS